MSDSEQLSVESTELEGVLLEIQATTLFELTDEGQEVWDNRLPFSEIPASEWITRALLRDINFARIIPAAKLLGGDSSCGRKCARQPILMDSYVDTLVGLVEAGLVRVVKPVATNKSALEGKLRWL